MPDVPEISTTTQIVSALGTLISVIIAALIVYIKSWARRIEEHQNAGSGEIQIVGGALADRASMRLLADAIQEDKLAKEEMTSAIRALVDVFKERLEVELQELEEKKIEAEVERRLKSQRGPGL